MAETTHNPEDLMKIKTLLTTFAVAVICVAPTMAVATSPASRPSSPNSCIELNHGDWNACNVGNSGSGDKPYRPVTDIPDSPNACIELNHGDWNACNVGNSGSGGAPYNDLSGAGRPHS